MDPSDARMQEKSPAEAAVSGAHGILMAHGLALPTHLAHAPELPAPGHGGTWFGNTVLPPHHPLCPSSLPAKCCSNSGHALPTVQISWILELLFYDKVTCICGKNIYFCSWLIFYLNGALLSWKTEGWVWCRAPRWQLLCQGRADATSWVTHNQNSHLVHMLLQTPSSDQNCSAFRLDVHPNSWL